MYNAKKQRIHYGLAGIDIRLASEKEPERIRMIQCGRLVSAAVFGAERRRLRRCREGAAGSVFALSLADIEKALRPKKDIRPEDFIPAKILREFKELFSPKEANRLPPHRPSIDHEVNLQLDRHRREPELPWGPLYGMSQEELLVLQKTLKDLLDKGFIRVSGSPAAAPVLFVRKPGGGLRFYCDYRALNAISKRDRYPLPLISETLNMLAQAKWYTKLDVVAAFNKIRIKEGHEERTAFRTRYGLFEWLVCPFGLSRAPATFQRYINKILHHYLNDFVTAYVDDMLIFSSGTLRNHKAKVQLVLRALADAGLHLDPQKCEFSVKSVKYLRFIVKASKGIACDPEKQRAIREWAAPTTVKRVRSFLGFTNYYRIFIPNYLTVTSPLIALTRKGVRFQWGPSEKAAFKELKRRFCEAPILRDWDPDRVTFVEADCSGAALGGVLSQEDKQEYRWAVAYHSKRLNPAEYNYPIHDKEMLAVVTCLLAWDLHLRDCQTFTILIDYRNLEYFIVRRKLSKRQSQ